MPNIIKLGKLFKNANVAKIEKSVEVKPTYTVVQPQKSTVAARNNLFTNIKKVETSAPAVGGNLAQTAKATKSTGSGLGKFVLGAGVGALGLSMADNLLGGGTATPEPLSPEQTEIPTPELQYAPELQYILDPNSGILYPYSEGSGGTAYLSGDGYGDNGGV